MLQATNVQAPPARVVLRVDHSPQSSIGGMVQLVPRKWHLRSPPLTVRRIQLSPNFLPTDSAIEPLGTWIGYKPYTDRERTEANLRGQYAKLAGVRIEVTDTAHHFIMWDDPNWMFGRIDRFFREHATAAAR